MLGGDSEAESLEDAFGDGVTAQDWITAGIILVVTIVAARVARRVVPRLVERAYEAGDISRLAGRLVQFVVVVVGLHFVLDALSVNIGPLIGALGIGGVAIAFAASAILENTFASIVLKARRPFRHGDQVQAGDHDGSVEDVNFRTVELRSYDGQQIFIPSSVVLGNAIVNHTARGTRRSTLAVGVGYATDLRRAQQVILEAVESVDGVLTAPSPEAWVTQFGDSSIDFDVRYWHAPDIATLFRVRSEVAMAIKEALDRDAIEIPFPQRVLTFAADSEAVDDERTGQGG